MKPENSSTENQTIGIVEAPHKAVLKALRQSIEQHLLASIRFPDLNLKVQDVCLEVLDALDKYDKAYESGIIHVTCTSTPSTPVGNSTPWTQEEGYMPREEGSFVPYLPIGTTVRLNNHGQTQYNILLTYYRKDSIGRKLKKVPHIKVIECGTDAGGFLIPLAEVIEWCTPKSKKWCKY